MDTDPENIYAKRAEERGETQPPTAPTAAIRPIIGTTTAEERARQEREEARDVRGEARAEAGLGLQLESAARSEREYNQRLIGDYRQQFFGMPEVRDFREVANSARQIIALAEGARTENDERAMSDMALVFSFMKVLDPTSSVREGEYASARNAAGIPDRIRTAYNNLINGEGLSPTQRAEMSRVARTLYNQRLTGYNEMAKIYSGLITDAGGDPARQGIVSYDPYEMPSAMEQPQMVIDEGPPPLYFTPDDTPVWYVDANGAPILGEDGKPLPVEGGYGLDKSTGEWGQFFSVTDTSEPARDPTENMGILEGIAESITGNARSTPEIEALPDWATMPEMNQLNWNSFQSAVATMMSNPQETAQILQSQFPGVRIRRDANGNYILRSPTDNREYAIKPGFRVSDIPRASGALLAFTPAGRATTVVGGVGGSALTQAGIEATQAMSGGEINPEEIVLAGAGGAIVPAVSRLAGGIRELRSGRAAMPEVRPAGPEIPPSGGAGPEVPTGGGAGPSALPSGGATPTPPRAPSVAEQQGISEEIVALARRAAGRGPGSGAARAELLELIDADPTLVQQVEVLGIELPADVFSANVQLKNLTGLARSQPGSAAEAGWQQTVSNAAQQVEEALTEMGASRDLAQLSDDVFTRLKSNMESLQRQGDELREAVNANLNMQSRVEATNLQDALAQTINDLGGIDEATQAMTSQERRLLQALGVGETPKQPTYAYMDRLRREIGDALNKGTGPWADTERVTLQRYYNALADDRIAHVGRELGFDAADDLAASNRIFQAMYATREEMTNLFGRDLDKGIGAQIRSVIAQGARGNTTNLRRLMAVIPEDMRAEVAFSGILANARSRGAEGGFSFPNFRNTYRAIRENAPVYRELARNMTESQRNFLDNLYGVSQGIADAQSRIISTGRARGGPAAEINAQSLTQKIVEQATRRGVGASVGMAGGTLTGDLMYGVPAAAVMESVMAYLGRGGASNLDRVSDVIGSAPYRDLVNEAARGGNMTRAINRLANSKPFGLFARSLGLNTQEARRAWISSALAAGATRQAEGEPEQAGPQAITVQ